MSSTVHSGTAASTVLCIPHRVHQSILS